MSSNGVSPPGGLNFAIAILALLSALLSIMGFIALYIPQTQYIDLLQQMRDIHMSFITWDWPPASDEKVRLWQKYNAIAMNVELFQHLATTPYHISVLHVSTVWKLRKLRGKARSLKVELIALYEIKRSKEIRKNMEMSTPDTSTATGTAPPDDLWQNIKREDKTPSRPWYRSNFEKIQVVEVNNVDRLPV